MTGRVTNLCGPDYVYVEWVDGFTTILPHSALVKVEFPKGAENEGSEI